VRGRGGGGVAEVAAVRRKWPRQSPRHPSRVRRRLGRRQHHGGTGRDRRRHAQPEQDLPHHGETPRHAGREARARQASMPNGHTDMKMMTRITEAEVVLHDRDRPKK